MTSRYLIGVDEVGNGAIAGPIAVCACYVPPEHWFTLRKWGFADSKTLTPEKRSELVQRLEDEHEALGVAWGVAMIEPIQIDIIGPLDAQLRAARTAVTMVLHQLDMAYEARACDAAVIVDGQDRLVGLPDGVEQVIIPKADQLYLPVSVASVIAKEMRDADMALMNRRYPAYNFAVNKGYPTLEHLTILLRVGPVYGLHRKHMLFRMLEQHYKTFLHYHMDLPSWMKDDRWLRNVDDDGAVVQTTWPVIDPNHPMYASQPGPAKNRGGRPKKPIPAGKRRSTTKKRDKNHE